MTKPSDIVRTYLQALWAGERESAKAQLSEDCEWCFLPSLEYPRTMSGFAATDAVLDDMIGAYTKGSKLKVELQFLIGGTAHVEAEYTARSTSSDGSSRENRYCLCAKVAGDKIIEIRLYTDTAPPKKLMKKDAA